jgi:hypothetical protein
MDLTGKWQGTVVYGADYRKYKFEELYFDMIITQQGNKIKGVAIDTGGIGVNISEATIKGSIKTSKIRFIKQYQVRQTFTANGSKRDESRKGLEIFYEGSFNELSQSFTGSWFMKKKIKRFLFFYRIHKNSGTWFMKPSDKTKFYKIS